MSQLEMPQLLLALPPLPPLLLLATQQGNAAAAARRLCCLLHVCWLGRLSAASRPWHCSEASFSEGLATKALKAFAVNHVVH